MPTNKRMQKISLILFPVILCFIFPSSLSAQNLGRQKINIDNDWKFAFGHSANPEKDFNYSLRTIFSKSAGTAGRSY